MPGTQACGTFLGQRFRRWYSDRSNESFQLRERNPLPAKGDPETTEYVVCRRRRPFQKTARPRLRTKPCSNKTTRQWSGKVLRNTLLALSIAAHLSRKKHPLLFAVWRILQERRVPRHPLFPAACTAVHCSVHAPTCVPRTCQ